MFVYDVAIIGAGICGASVAYMLGKYDLNICVIEKETDVAMGTTKANSAIIHAGYDPEEGTLMAKLNVKGSKQIKEICKKLSVPYKQIGSLVIAFSEDDLKTIDVLYNRGINNGVEGLEILTKEQVLKLEPNINKEVFGALLAKSAAVVSPWELDIAMLETSVQNGAQIMLDSKVTNATKKDDYFEVEINGGEKSICAKYIVNAAGLYADEINDVFADHDFNIYPNKGQYYLLDKSQGEKVNHIIFQCPTKVGKGVLVSPTVHGNLIIGPDSAEISNANDLATEGVNLDYVQEMAALTTDKINYRENVRNFAGNRAYSDRSDFIVEISPTEEKLINVAGIKSPGLSSAPAIGDEVVCLLEKSGLQLKLKQTYIDKREKVHFNELSSSEKAKLIKKDSRYGNVICRCNTITEAEILDAIHSPIPPTTLDAVKRRAGTGMGRCQGGFCSPRIHEMLAKELGVSMEQIELEKKGSYIVTGRTKNQGGQSR